MLNGRFIGEMTSKFARLTKLKKYYLSGFFLLGVLTLFVSLMVFGWTPTWSCLRQPTMEPPFVDLRVVQAGVIRERVGVDPHTPDEHHAWKMPMNYPKIWVPIGRHLQIEKEGSLIFIAIASIVLYLSACAILIFRYPSLYMLLFPFSFSSLLLIERGNNDLIIFSILFYFIWISSSMAVFAVLLTSALKIYPIFALGCLFKRKKQLLGVGLCVAAYFLWKSEEIHTVKNLTPVGGWCSYGVKSFKYALEYKFRAMCNAQLEISEIYLYLTLGLFFALFFLWVRRHTWLIETACQGFEKRLFLAGSGIFCGTFVFASNFDYRLCFLLFCLPLLSKMTNKKMYHFSMVMVLIAVNGSLIQMNVADLANLFAKACLFVLLGGLGLSLFLDEWGWLRRDFHHAPGKKEH